MPRDWLGLLDHAARIVESYDTGVTLRQLFYRLVADWSLPNTVGAYKGLSSKSAEARRRGTFPELIDLGRTIHQHMTFSSPADALDQIAQAYRRDRTEGQDTSIYIGVEKAGLVAQLTAWFGELGVPILALGGYSSQSYIHRVIEDVQAQDRSAILLYAGDFDPSGEDIDRDFVARTGCFDKVVRVALDAHQVTEYGLPPQPGKGTDSRAGAFVARHGELVQVELDALDPTDLHSLFGEAIDQFWDVSAYEVVMAAEIADRTVLEQLVSDRK